MSIFSSCVWSAHVGIVSKQHVNIVHLSSTEINPGPLEKLNFINWCLSHIKLETLCVCLHVCLYLCFCVCVGLCVCVCHGALVLY